MVIMAYSKNNLHALSVSIFKEKFENLKRFENDVGFSNKFLVLQIFVQMDRDGEHDQK